MIRLSPLLAGLLCFAPIAHGESIYKCVSPTGVTYQGSPCDGAETIKVPAGTHYASPRAAGTPRCQARPMPMSSWRPRSLCIGITDDEVLNLAGWGRPTNIARVRGERGWQEKWEYVSRAAGSRRLEFFNGKLASVETAMTEENASTRVPIAFLTRTE